MLQALTQAAMDATGATDGWLLVLHGDRLRVAAAAGESESLIGADVSADTGVAGFVATSGRPLALSGGGDDLRLSEGVPFLLGRRPSCIVSVPCLDDDVLTGVLELVDKPAGAFTFDDVEMATLLAAVAGVALTSDAPVPAVPGPEDLAAGLHRMAAADPARYAALAGLIAVLLSRE